MTPALLTNPLFPPITHSCPSQDVLVTPSTQPRLQSEFVLLCPQQQIPGLGWCPAQALPAPVSHGTSAGEESLLPLWDPTVLQHPTPPPLAEDISLFDTIPRPPSGWGGWGALTTSPGEPRVDKLWQQLTHVLQDPQRAPKNSFPSDTVLHCPTLRAP